MSSVLSIFAFDMSFLHRCETSLFQSLVACVRKGCVRIPKYWSLGGGEIAKLYWPSTLRKPKTVSASAFSGWRANFVMDAARHSL